MAAKLWVLEHFWFCHDLDEHMAGFALVSLLADLECYD